VAATGPAKPSPTSAGTYAMCKPHARFDSREHLSTH
jgi:hypothetical protein